MAVGSVYTARAPATSLISNDALASETLLTYDTEVDSSADVTRQSGNQAFRLQSSGRYLILTSTSWNGIDLGNNNRAVVRTQVKVGGTALTGISGNASGYLRDSGSADECHVLTASYVDHTVVGSAADDVTVHVQNFGDTSVALADQIANSCGVQIIRLDDGADWLQVRRAAAQSLVSSQGTGVTVPVDGDFTTISFDTQDVETDSAVLEWVSGTDVTLKSAGHYLVILNVFGQSTNTTRQGAIHKLMLNDVNIDGGTWGLNMSRGSDGSNESWTCLPIILDVAANDVLTVDMVCISESTTAYPIEEVQLTAIKLPDTADYIRTRHSTSRDGQTQGVFPQDAEDEDDLGFHSTVTNNDRIDGTADDHDMLLLGAWFTSQTSLTNSTRVTHHFRWSRTGTIVQYGSGLSYHRGDQSTTGVKFGGRSAGLAAKALGAAEYLSLDMRLEASTTDQTRDFPANRVGITGVALDTLAGAAAQDMTPALATSLVSTFDPTVVAVGPALDMTLALAQSLVSAFDVQVVGFAGGLAAGDFAAYYDARFISGGVGDITQWDDLSGNDRHLQTPATPNDPAVSTSYFGGLQSVRFDDTNTEAIEYDEGSEFYTGDIGIITVVHLVSQVNVNSADAIFSAAGSTPSTSKHILGTDDQPTNTEWVGMSGDGSGPVHINFGSPVVGNAFVVTQFVDNDGDEKYWQDGTLESTAASGGNNLQGWRLGGREDNTRWCDVAIAFQCFIEMDGLTETDLLNVRDDVADIFGIEFVGSVEPAVAQSLVTAFDVTLTPGAVDVAATLAQQLVTAIDPVITVGAVDIAPTVVQQLVSVFDPTLTVGATDIAPAIATSVTAAFDPTLTTTVDVTLALAQSLAAAFGPAISTGAVSTSPELAQALVAAYDPVVVVGAGVQEIIAAVVTQLAQAFDPSLSTTVDVTLELVQQLASAFDVTLSVGAVDISPSLAQQLISAHDPTLSIEQFVTLDAVTQLVTAFAAALTTGAVDIAAGLAQQLVSAFDVTVVADQLVEPQIATSLVSAFNVTVSAGVSFVQPTLTQQLVVAFDATVTSTVNVAAELAQQLAVAFDPALSTDIDVTTERAQTLVTAFDPVLSVGAVDVSPALVQQLAQAFNVTVVTEQIVDVELAQTLVAAFDPIVSAGVSFIVPSLAQSLASAFDVTLALEVNCDTATQLVVAFDLVVDSTLPVQDVQPELAQSLLTAFDPTFSTSTVDMTLELAVSTLTAFDPTLTYTIGMQPEIASSLLTAFDPQLIIDQFVSLSRASSGIQAFDPTVAAVVVTVTVPSATTLGMEDTPLDSRRRQQTRRHVEPDTTRQRRRR